METFRIKEQEELSVIVDHLLQRVRESDDGASVVALHGDLGTGKTTFTQTLAKELGVSEVVTSPTFVIMKGYELTHPLFDRLIHIDAYRLDSAEELTVLGFTKLIETPRTLVVIEWAEKVAELLPASTIHLSFSIEEDDRVITFHHG